MTDHELKTVPIANAPVTLVPVSRGWMISRGHVFASLLWISVAIAAAVALGEGDWYVRELSDSLGNFHTYYYGLRLRVDCPLPSVAAPAGSTQYWPPQNGVPCHQATYQALFEGAPVDTSIDSQRTAFQHLIGAADIIIAMLSLTLVFAILAALLSFQYGTRYDNDVTDDHIARHHRGARLLGFLALITVLLAIIFWITIFPYRYARNVENSDALAANPGFNAYLSFGTALGILIAAVFVSLLALASGHRQHKHQYRVTTASPLPVV